MSWDESADYSTDVVVPKWNFGKLIAVPGGSGPPGPKGDKGDVGPQGEVGPVGPSGTMATFATVSAFPAVGDPANLYVAEDTNDTYRWDGTKYVRVSERVPSTGIEDSTTVGRAVVTAVDEAAARAAIGAVDSTSNLWRQPPVDATGVSLNIGSQSNTFFGVQNPVGFIGLNVDCAGATLDTTEHSVAFGVEQNYNENDETLLMEAYIQYCAPYSGAVGLDKIRRPLFSKYSKETNEIVQTSINGGTVNINTTGGSDDVVGIPVTSFTRGNVFISAAEPNQLTSLTIDAAGAGVSRLQLRYDGVNSCSFNAVESGRLLIESNISTALASDYFAFLAADQVTPVAQFVQGDVRVSASKVGGTVFTVESGPSQWSKFRLFFNQAEAAAFATYGSSVSAFEIAGQDVCYLYGRVFGQPGKAMSVGSPDNSAAITGKASLSTQKGIVAQGTANQSASVFEAQNSAQVPLVSVPATGGLVIGNSVLPTTATTGFLYAPQISGTPTGTPVVNPGTTPIVFDDVNQKLMIYTAGVWKSIAVV